MSTGKAIRLERIINRNTGRTFIVPMDHGVTVGPLEGIRDIRAAVAAIAEGGADAGLVHKGIARLGHRGSGRDLGLIIHLSACTSLSPSANTKVLVGTVEEALKLGADGVSIHVNIGDENEPSMLADFGRIAASAAEWGVPLLAMVYARGPKVANEFDPDAVAHCARVGAELGADIIKVHYSGSVESFSRVVQGAGGVPVVIAGGERTDSVRSFLDMVRDALDAGASGLSVGRNVFQHPDPRALATVLRRLVHEDMAVDEALNGVSGVV
ncbi:2-amino-3,7-dideoxy-D-threo-hept-6-ulosonate synthase [Salidesulfovibrio onnuriiensis]|uniref:2-amino-3,7-dideoxy-D-threo-hept-6-ulosonate synthase n=1 Tax=Salidesulfovibrio onnuriiensis TaxID=2583823 RepID=UPI0011C935A6|nr:2-amino-3,7-dideoxy-D-threo-hept-6-ulosonate synthase [Salidesulfovibrio onnuriiensis]